MPTPANACRFKKRHATFSNAVVAAKKTGEKHGGRGFYAYQCPSCGFFHVAHRDRVERRNARMEKLIKLIDKANGR